MSESTGVEIKPEVMGHPSQLFVIFFTEMWERFSYYGMRALLIMFLTASIMDGGWGWPQRHAFAIFGTYVSLVYLSAVVGGWLADNKIGYRNAILIGALLMTLGHACMAFETQFFVYLGLTLLVVGSGFFKPCMTAMISELYKGHEEKKDGAYTIFYMGVNAGAFLGILLCGYLGEKIGWSLGFGLAGIFMFFGLLQFWFAKDIFGNVGLVPTDGRFGNVEIDENDPLNPFTGFQKALIAISAFLSLSWIINDPVSKISEGSINLFGFMDGISSSIAGADLMIITALILFMIVLIIRIPKYGNITRDRMLAVTFFCIVTAIFWSIFEQAPGSLTIFARDYTDRVLEGGAGTTFKIVNSLMAIIPLIILNYALYQLFRKTFGKYSLSNLFLATSFFIIWGITLWMLWNQFNEASPEVPASWFGVLNSLFIIAFAPLFSKWWESKYNPNPNMKYAIGMGLLALGMAMVAIGASGIPVGAKTASVSMVWLILVYLFHTLGELCISPVSLSLVSKLVPGRMIAFMFAIYYIAIAVGMKLAGMIGGSAEGIAEEKGLSYFFWILTAVAAGFAILSVVLYPIVKKWMHGVK